MVAIQKRFPRFTPEQYLTWEEQQELKYEYIDGEVYAMTGGTVNHGQVATSLIRLLGNHLVGKGCRILSSDVKVSIARSIDYVYPDISVTCDERDRTAEKYISHPCLVIEILSPSTAGYDRGEKFRMYRRSDALQEYVLVSTDKIEVDIYLRGDLGQWTIINYSAGDTVELTSIEMSWPIEELYAGIIFNNSQSSVAPLSE